jgi:PAS domain S-box-containing protein
VNCDDLDWLAAHYLTNTADGILVVDSAGAISCGNAHAEEMFGVAEDELAGQPLELLIPSRLRDQHVDHRRSYMVAPRPYRMGQRLNIAGLRRDGSEFPVDISLTPVVNRDETFVICALRDMSRLRHVEHTLRWQTQELQANDRRKDEFIATLTHELRNPLATASNWIGVLEREFDRDDLRDRALQGLQQQTARMQRLIEDLADIGRVRRGEVLLDLRSVDLVDLVKLAAEDFRLSSNERAHSLKLKLPDTPVPVRADPGRLTQVILNLLSNAARYSPNAGDIIVTVLAEEAHAVVKVRDFGIGIPNEKLSAIFKVFTRLDPAKAACPRGLGLGLSIVKRLIELHGGTVSAYSEGAERGSEFVVRLPRWQTDRSGELLAAEKMPSNFP